jgi:hypothetical protein
LHRTEKGADPDDYVAPEERSARAVDGRADLFALCRIFLEVVLGRRLEAGESITAPAGYPDALLELLLRGVQGDPAARCRSFAEVIHAVDRLLGDAFSAPARPTVSRAAA